MRWRAAGALALAALLAGCGAKGGGDAAAGSTTGPVPLEQAAIAAGLVPDPTADPTGLYARAGDRVCVVPAPTGWRVGVVLDVDEEMGCAAAGTLRRAGEGLAIDLGEGCAFAARFEGDRIVFPASVPSACARLCTQRASLSALDVPILSDAPAEAQTLRDRRGRRVCAPA